MPTHEQLTSLRAKLEEDLRSSLDAIDNLDQESDALADDSSQEGIAPANHMADVGTNVYESERLMTIEQEMRDRVTVIEEALQRMDDGSYGTCRRCGREIPYERLEIMPFANYCVECQEFVDTQNVETGRKAAQPLQP